MRNSAGAIYISSSIFVILYILNLLMDSDVRYSLFLWIFPIILLSLGLYSERESVKEIMNGKTENVSS